MQENSEVLDQIKSEGWIEPWRNKDHECEYWTHKNYPYLELDTNKNYGNVIIRIHQKGKLAEIAKSDIREIVLTKVDIFLAGSIIELVLQESL